MQRLPISGVVIAFNEADRIARCVESLAEVCDEVVVMDSGSTDATARIAESLGARVVQQPWLGFSAQKNAVVAQAKNPWVLLLDSDEWLDAQAGTKIATLFSSG
ncbi:glycosyltransferase family 2 protein, partial [Escherichia coli]|uniref:glycosyltransferase family 2 protein n=1 Tax=Escherichia coli TaxID=562 RepID=UPI0021570E2E